MPVHLSCRGLLILAIVSAACSSDAAVAPSRAPKSEAGTPALPPLAGSLQIVGDTGVLLAGSRRDFEIEAFDADNASVNTVDAVVTSSDPSIADVSETGFVTTRDTRTGRTWKDLSVHVSFVSAGSVTLQATLGGASTSIQLRVQPQPSTSTALVVDSFTVVEYHPSCAWACPYLAYAPLLVLREPTGSSSVEVIAVEFTLGSMATGLCRGSLTYQPGMSAHLNGIDDYLWSNDLIFVSLDGQPLPGDSATARVIVRQVDGTYGRIDAVGAVQRGIANPVLPAPVSNWACY